MLAVLRKLLALGNPPSHMLTSAQGEHMPHQFVTASMCCALTTTPFLVLPIYIYFPCGAPDVPGGVQLTPPAFTLPQVREPSCCQGVGHDLGTAVGAVPPAKPCAVPHSPSPDWAGRPRSQGLQGRAKPVYFTALVCAEPFPSRQLHSSLWSVSQPGVDPRELQQAGRTAQPWARRQGLHPVGAPRGDEPRSHHPPLVHEEVEGCTCIRL